MKWGEIQNVSHSKNVPKGNKLKLYIFKNVMKYISM